MAGINIRIKCKTELPDLKTGQRPVHIENITIPLPLVPGDKRTFVPNSDYPMVFEVEWEVLDDDITCLACNTFNDADQWEDGKCPNCGVVKPELYDEIQERRAGAFNSR